MTHEMTQQLRIRQLVENWAVWRDAGLWDKFRTVWHDDGVMMATWFQGPFEEFIRVTIEGWNKGVSISWADRPLKSKGPAPFLKQK
jgi:hypothetical protein